MKNSLDALTASLLDAAQKAGATSADSLAVQGTSLSIDVRNGDLEQAERAEGVEIGLRVLVGQRQACISASDTNPDTIVQMAERAVAMAKEAPEDPYIGLANPQDLFQTDQAVDLQISDPRPEPSPQALQEDARRAEAAANGFDGISQVQSASAGYGENTIHLAASNGFSQGYTRTSRSTSCVAITGHGTDMERDYAHESRIFQGDLPDAADIGILAAQRTLERAGARKPKTGTFPVLYDERIAASLIGHLLAAINGSSIARGSSWLLDARGEQVLPASLSLMAEPHRPRISGSRLFDAEGLPTQPRAVVENGVLQEWILDLATARKLGLKSTANAARGTSSPPSPSAGNITLTAGALSKDGLLKEMGTGLLVTSLIGSSINANTGDYSRGASGFWVENGEITYPVNECTIAGNLRDMLKSILPANDARTHLSRLVPSLLVEGLTLAGE